MTLLSITLSNEVQVALIAGMSTLMTLLISRLIYKSKLEAEVRDLNAQAEFNEIQAAQGMMNMFKEANLELRRQIELLQTQIEKLTLEVNQLSKEKADWKLTVKLNTDT